MDTKASGHYWHTQSEELREKDDLVGALKCIEEALVSYQQEKEYRGFAMALQTRVLIYKHLFLLTRDEVFSLLAKKDAEASLEIARRKSITDIIGSCYFRLGETANLSKDYEKAVEYFQKALDEYRGTDAEKGDYRYHLGEALYRFGKKKEGKEILLQGLREIQDHRHQVQPFLVHVWESGCCMKLAELLKDDEPEEARAYLQKAQEIIHSDDTLVIRKRQLAELQHHF